MKNRREAFLVWATPLFVLLVLAFQPTAQAANIRTVYNVGGAPAGMNIVDVAANADYACYVHLFDGDNFEDDNAIIRGPGKWGNLQNLPSASGVEWEGDADSLKVGATATVKIWADEDFQGASQTFGPGAREADVDHEFKSMEISCQ